MRFSRSVSFIFAGILCGISSAQTAQISGTVVDPNRAAIPRATVRLLSGSKEIGHTLSDQQGKFSFPQACNSGCSVEVQLAGFEDKTVPVPLTNPEIKLELAPVQEHLNVTANLTETPTEQVGSSVTTISTKEIDDRQTLPLSDLLQTVPGAIVNRSGGRGTTTSLFLRGGERDYTKILVDGIPVNEPGGTFEFGSFASDGVARVEVVRGPQSALFGTDAMTGVVQIFTRRGSSEDSRPHLRLDFDAGKYNTFHGGVGVEGQLKKFDYAGDWSRFDTDNEGPNAAFRDSTGGFNFGYSLNDKTQIRFIGRGDSSLAGTPGQTAFFPPDPGAFFSKADGYTGFTISQRTTDNWHQRATYAYERSRQVSRADMFVSDFINDTRRQHVDYQSDWTLGSGDRAYGQHIFTVAFGWDRETGFIGDDASTFFASTHALRDNLGGTLQHQVVLGRLVLSNGVRVEGNGSFGEAVVPRSSLAYLLRQGSGAFGATKLKFNFGLGIKEPNFTESFSPEPAFLGNRHLRPERARSFDFGIEQRLWNDHAKIEVDWFDNRFRDMVAFTAKSFTEGSYINLGKTKANGAELIVETVPTRGLHVTGTYTYLNSQIVESPTPTDPVNGVGQSLIRRPRHSGSLGLVWDCRKLTFSSTTLYVGRRVDSDFLGLGLTSSSPYSKWDVALAYRLTRQLSFTSVFENVLDHRYMESLGFPALRATYRSGLRVRF
ncbi:MAG TPA: TonB-dependent receptor plug domain-containing protein [Terriglobales bacterium]